MLQFRVLTFVILYFPSPPKFQKYTIYIFRKSRHSQYGSNVWIYAPIIQTRLIHVNSKLCAMLLQPQLEFGFLGLMLCLFGGDLLFAANTQTHDWETQKAYISQWCFKMLYLTQKSVPMNFSSSFVQTFVLCANNCASPLCKHQHWTLSGSIPSSLDHPPKSFTSQRSLKSLGKKLNKENFTASSSILFKKNFTKSCRAHRSLKNVNNLELFLLSPLFFSTKNFYIPHKYDSKKLKRFESFSNLFMWILSRWSTKKF